MVDVHNQELGVSPDGIVYNKGTKQYGVLEIKNVLKDKPLTLIEACNKLSNFCLEVVGDGKLQLKRNHAFYYQCQAI